MVDAVGVVGSVNLYGASGKAFEDHHEELAEMLGGWAPGAVRNADLSFNTRAMAEQAPQSLRAEGLITRAIGMIVVRQGTDVTTAQELLDTAANRAGIRPEQLAEALIQLGTCPSASHTLQVAAGFGPGPRGVEAVESRCPTCGYRVVMDTPRTLLAPAQDDAAASDGVVAVAGPGTRSRRTRASRAATTTSWSEPG